MKRALGLLLGISLGALGSPRVPAPAVAGFQELPCPGTSAFQKYGAEDGLMSMGISSLAQDAEGYVWAGTDLGLFRFDGHRFRNLGTAEGFSLTGNTRVYADPLSGLWTTNMKGLYRVEGFRATRADGTRGLPSGLATAVAFDDQHHAWIAMGPQGLFRQTEAGSFVPHPCREAVHAMAWAPRHGGMVLADAQGKVTLWRRGARVEAWDLPGHEDLESAKCLEDGEGRIWLFTPRGLWFKPPQEQTFQPFRHPFLEAGGDRRDAVPDGAGGLWTATVRGLLHIRGSHWTAWTTREGMPTRSAAHVLVDREGSLWYASTGLFRHAGLGAWTFQGTAEGLPTELVWALDQDASGRLWAGTNLGLAVQEGKSWHLVPGAENKTIFNLIPLEGGGMLASGRYHELLYVPPGGRKASSIPNPLGPDPARVFRLFKDPAGGFVITGREAFARAKVVGSRILVTEKVPVSDPRFLNSAYQCLAEPDGTIWFPNRLGLARYRQGSWRSWGTADGLPGEGIFGVARAPDGTLLVSFYNGFGVSRLRIEGDSLKVLRSYRSAQGDLPTDNVFSIHHDRQGRTWLLTDQGLVLFKEGDSHAFGVGVGMASPDMVVGTFLEARDGALWAASASGLCRFDAPAFPWDFRVPSPTLVGLRFGDQVDRAKDAGPLLVPAKHNNLEVDLGFLSYARGKGFSYETRIDGLDDCWRRDSQPRLHYMSLPPGSFILRTRAVVDGKPGPETVRSFRVLPRWYQRRDVIAGAGLAGLAAIWAGFALRGRYYRRANARLETLVRDRTSELEQAYRQMEELSVSDALTHLHNRHYLSLTLPEQLALVARSLRDTPKREGPPGMTYHPLTFLMLDLDHFKQVNDTHGHEAGDEVLRQLAAVFQSVLRDADSIVRWGGEEFLVLARHPDCADPIVLAERLRKAVEEHAFRISEQVVLRKTVSIGFAVYPLGMSLPLPNWEQGVALADRALYAAKRSGRNGWIGLHEGPAFDRQALEAMDGNLDVQSLLDDGRLRTVASFPSPSPEAWQ